jgi:hypothetical protein
MLDVCKSITMLMSSATLTCIAMEQHGTVCLVSFTTRRMTDVIGFCGAKRSIDLIYCSLQRCFRTCCDFIFHTELFHKLYKIHWNKNVKYFRGRLILCMQYQQLWIPIAPLNNLFFTHSSDSFIICSWMSEQLHSLQIFNKSFMKYLKAAFIISICT